MKINHHLFVYFVFLVFSLKAKHVDFNQVAFFVNAKIHDLPKKCYDFYSYEKYFLIKLYIEMDQECHNKYKKITKLEFLKNSFRHTHNLFITFSENQFHLTYENRSLLKINDYLHFTFHKKVKSSNKNNKTGNLYTIHFETKGGFLELLSRNNILDLNDFDHYRNALGVKNYTHLSYAEIVKLNNEICLQVNEKCDVIKSECDKCYGKIVSVINSKCESKLSKMCYDENKNCGHKGLFACLNLGIPSSISLKDRCSSPSDYAYCTDGSMPYCQGNGDSIICI